MGIIASIIASVFRHNPRQRLLRSLRGCSFTIPDLEETFAHWPQDVNPESSRLEKAVEQRLDLFFPRGEVARKMKEVGVAEFGAAWWPCASFERLCVATFLSLWLFAWDDVTDSIEISDLVNQNGRAAVFREQTKELIHASLSDNWEAKELQLAGQKSPLIANFGTVGRAITESCTPEQKARFLSELDLFIDMSALEQQVQLSGRLPTVEEYSRRRMGSSAVGVCLAITDYMYRMEIPASIMDEKRMRRLWDLTNIIVSTTNDIMSLKKEIAHDQTDSLVPLLFVRYGDLQTAINVASDTVVSSVTEFDEVSEQVLGHYFDDENMTINLKNFIEGCQYACTANLNWGLRSARYKLPSNSLKGGLRVTLE